MPSNKFLIKFISFTALILAFNNTLLAGPWLEDSKEATLSASAFISSRLGVESYKGYLSYGITDNWNVILQSTYKQDKEFLYNELSLKRKIIEQYFDNSQYIISIEISTKNVIEGYKNFNFIENVGTLLTGVKLGSIFATFEPSIKISTNTEYNSEFSFAIGYDYSDYSTIIFAKTLSSIDERWKIALFKNLLGNLDLNLEYSHHVDNYDKFSIGLWYKMVK
ncbi:MAG: hypothetical protein HRK26_01975 [Rickettsiaceae bacterium H1]|nr:hypothetical protein [Rickettsiaceae bacterium H1]